MTKSELISKIAARNPNLLQRDVEHIVEIIIESITQALVHGDRVEFRGFGVFSVHIRPARMAKNPRTGEDIHIGERWSPHFKAGRELLSMINGGKL